MGLYNTVDETQVSIEKLYSLTTKKLIIDNPSDL